jgi:DNA helicase-2/ATP-dependent DNA helicase PcrA
MTEPELERDGAPVPTADSKQSERAAELLKGLSETQRRAASHPKGPLVVFAGAGSGKTRVIAHRIAWLIETGVRPWEILAMTFTNKAAGEMRSRVAALTPFAGRALIGTFHSACARWLREFAGELGFTSDFTIYDDDDSLAAVKLVLGELNVKMDDKTTAQEFKAAINKAKTMALLPSDEQLRRDEWGILPPGGAAVYERYQEYLASCNAMDFGDLIMNVLLLLRRNAVVRDIMQQRYRYILVDEYQDTNKTQFELVQRLAERHRNLFVVGDDDQSIYSWRGAVPSNIIEFDKTYPDAHKVTLPTNYRCSGTIVAAASAMVAHNQYRVAKELRTDNDPGDKIGFRMEADNDLEAWWVVDQIRSEAKRFALGDIAVFYRTNGQSRVLEDALRRENIQYQIYGTVRFYDRAEVKDLMAYLRLLVNPQDDISVRRVLNVPPRGIGDKAEELLEGEAKRRGLPLLKTAELLVEEGAPKLGPKLATFTRIMAGLREKLATTKLDEILEELVSATGYMEYVRKRFPEAAADKVDNIHELGAALADQLAANADATLADWLQSVSLVSEEKDGPGGVTLMTLHMAKGLEFPRVFVVGVEEGLLPHHNSLEDKMTLEEERRLLYVGMTRAKEKLSLTSAYRRRTYNTWAANRPSRFLSEIPRELFEPVTEAEQRHMREVAGGYAYARDDDEDDEGGDSDRGVDRGPRYDYGDEGGASPSFRARVAAGDTVDHPTYGRGVVSEVVEEFGLVKAVVRFDDFGVRKVMVHHLQ